MPVKTIVLGRAYQLRSGISGKARQATAVAVVGNRVIVRMTDTGRERPISRSRLWADRLEQSTAFTLPDDGLEQLLDKILS